MCQLGKTEDGENIFFKVLANIFRLTMEVVKRGINSEKQPCFDN